MNIKELLLEYYDVEQDQLHKSEIHDKRRPRLTLKHLNSLRKLRDLKAVENMEHAEFVSYMYGSQE